MRIDHHHNDAQVVAELIETLELLEAASFRAQAKALVNKAKTTLQNATADLQRHIQSKGRANPLQVAKWFGRITVSLTRHAPAIARLGWLAGGGDPKDIPRTLKGIATGVGEVVRYIADQLRFLNAWRAQVTTNNAVVGGNQRADLYAQSLEGLYNTMWNDGMSTATGMPKLPAQPRDGTTICLTNCQCRWRVERDKGSDAPRWRAYWTLSPVESCPTCLCRARRWNPLTLTFTGGRWETKDSGRSQCELYRS